MKYKVFYYTDNGKRFCNTVEASSEKDAEVKIKNKYHDISEIVRVISCISTNY